MKRRPAVNIASKLYQRVAAFLILCASTLGLFVFLLYFFLNSSYTGQILETSMGMLFRGKIGFSRITFGPWPSQIRVHNFFIADPEGGHPISAEEVHIENYDLLGLKDLHIGAQDIRMVGVTIHLKSRPDPEAFDELGHPREAFNIERAFWMHQFSPDSGDPTGTVPTLDFAEASLERATLILDMDPISVEVNNINASGVHFGLNPVEISTMAIDATDLSADQVRIRLKTGDTPDSAYEASDDQVMTLPFENLAVREFHWRGMQFNILSIALTARQDPTSIRNFAMSLEGAGLPHMAADLSLQIADLNNHIEPLNLGLGPINGAVTLSFQGQGELDAMEGDFSLQGAGLDALGYQLDSLSLMGHKSPLNRIDLSHLTLEGFGGLIAGAASFDVPSGNAFADLTFKRLDLINLPIELPKEVQALAKGPLTGSVRVRGTDTLTSNRSLSVETWGDLQRRGPLGLYGIGPSAQFELLASAHGDEFKLNQFSFQTGPYQAQTDASISLENGLEGLDLNSSKLRAQGSMLTLDLGSALRSFGVTDADGQIHINFKTQGALTSPNVDVTLTGKSLRYAEFKDIRLNSKVSMNTQSGRTKLKSLKLQTPAGQIEVSGQADVFKKNLPFSATLQIRDLDLAKLPLGLSLHGILNADLKLSGNSVKPKVEIERFEITGPGYDQLVFDSLSLKGSFANNQAELESFALRYQDRDLITLEGLFNLKNQHFKGDFALIELPLTLANAFVDPPLPLQGALSMHYSAEGNLKGHEGEGSILFEDIAYDKFTLGTTELALKADGRRVHLKGNLFNLLDLIVQAPLSHRDEKAAVALSFNELHVEDHLPELKESGISTTITGKIAASADIYNFDPKQLIARVEIPQFEAQMPNLALHAQTPLKLEFKHQAITLDEFILAQTDGKTEETSEIHISAKVDRNQQVDAKIQGELNLATVQGFVNSVFSRMDGKADFDIAITGSLTDPHTNGELRLLAFDARPRTSIIGRELRLMYPAALQISSPLNSNKPGVIHVGLTSPSNQSNAPSPGRRRSRLSLRRDEGQIDIKEITVDLENFAPKSIVLALDASEQSINVPQMVRATANATDLKVEMLARPGSKGQDELMLKVSGDIDILRGAYTGDLMSSSDINQGVRNTLGGRSKSSSVSALESNPALKQLLQRLMLDMHVHGENDFFVQNNVAVLTLNLEVRHDIRVKGYLQSMPGDSDDDKLQIDGSVDILSDSTITYARRAFEVTEGSILLGGGNFLSASVEANHTFQLRSDQGPSSGTFDKGASDVKLEEVVLNANVTMSSPVSKPEIDFTLTSSSGASQIEVITLVLTGSYPAGLNGAQSAQPATELILAPLLELIERPLEETLDLDLTLTPATSGTLYIAADKTLSRRMRVYARTPIGEEDDNNPPTFGLEYRINNLFYSELTSQQVGSVNTTSGRLRLRLMMD